MMHKTKIPYNVCIAVLLVRIGYKFARYLQNNMKLHFIFLMSRLIARRQVDACDHVDLKTTNFNEMVLW